MDEGQSFVMLELVKGSTTANSQEEWTKHNWIIIVY
jgi:hypothetical protein